MATARRSHSIVANNSTMVGLNRRQRRILSEKLPDVANLAAAGLIFAQFVGSQCFSRAVRTNHDRSVRHVGRNAAVLVHHCPGRLARRTQETARGSLPVTGRSRYTRVYRAASAQP